MSPDCTTNREADARPVPICFHLSFLDAGAGARPGVRWPPKPASALSGKAALPLFRRSQRLKARGPRSEQMTLHQSGAHQQRSGAYQQEQGLAHQAAQSDLQQKPRQRDGHGDQNADERGGGLLDHRRVAECIQLGGSRGDIKSEWGGKEREGDPGERHQQSVQPGQAQRQGEQRGTRQQAGEGEQQLETGLNPKQRGGALQEPLSGSTAGFPPG